MELELKDESCGFRLSVQVGTDLMKQKESNSAKKRVHRAHLGTSQELHWRLPADL